MTSSEPTAPDLTLEQKMERVWTLVMFVFSLAAIAVAAYFYAFRKHTAGGPEAWGQFGDYFGGVINPIVGLITVMLVVITLGVTRREAAGQRELLQEQLKDSKLQQVLAEHQKRLDGALSSWQALLETAPEFGRGDRAGLLAMLHGKKLRDSLNDPSVHAAATQRVLDEPLAEADGAYASLAPLSEMLGELAEYISAYDEVSGSHVLTNYYRRRVATAAFVLHRFQLLDAGVANELTPRT